jgi:two-component system response regulator HydG
MKGQNMGNGLRILIIDDDIYISKLLENYLKREGHEPIAASRGRKALELMKDKNPDVVLCDIRLPDINGVELLPMLKRISPEVPVIMMTAYADIQTTVQAIKTGAFDYVSKPVYPEEIVALIKRSLKEKKEPEKKREPDIEVEFITGDSDRMKKAVKLAGLVAPTNMSVLIQGETGSGKEFVARLIHNQSKRKNKQFIALDCGAIPHELAASELFGHVKGAFTGAVNNKTGYFEKANKGTIFLDEIGNLSYETQVKLLRAIQHKVISRVGDNNDIPVDVRIISATNRDLREAIEDGQFREDLYHRINEFKIEIPPLRDRGNDIMLFARHFLWEANIELGKDIKDFSPTVENIFNQYGWHGNLRELRNVVKRSVLITDTDIVQEESLPEEIRRIPDMPQEYRSVEGNKPDLKDASREAEKMVIIKALRENNFNKTKTATALKIDRKTLYNKIKQLEIDLGELH